MNFFHCKEQAIGESIDRELVRRMECGDRAALATLFRRYHAPLFQFISRLMRPPSVIGDVIDETFWIAWQRATDLPSSLRVSTWLFGIAYRCSLKALSRCDGKRVDVDRAASRRPSTGGLDQQGKWRDELIKGIDELELDQRALIAMVYGAGQDLKEVAAIMGCQVGVVHLRLVQARDCLRAAIPAPDKGRGRSKP